jgi:hypothetical protein
MILNSSLHCAWPPFQQSQLRALRTTLDEEGAHGQFIGSRELNCRIQFPVIVLHTITSFPDRSQEAAVCPFGDNLTTGGPSTCFGPGDDVLLAVRRCLAAASSHLLMVVHERLLTSHKNTLYHSRPVSTSTSHKITLLRLQSISVNIS